MLMKIDWSLLPSELLELISNHLTFDPDYVRFRSVCTSWRSSAPKRPLLPWLIGNRKDEKGNPTIFSFVKFSSKGDEILPIPELPESNLFNGMLCVVGSSNGWMALMNPTSLSMILFNPVTKSTIPLPNPPKDEDGSISDIIFLDPAASLPVGCAALAFCWIRQSFSFCSSVGGGPGAHWIPMHVPNFISQCDSCFFRGRLYLSGHSTVYVCDFGREPSIRQIASLNQASFEYSMISRSHLVESNGDLLLVLACNFSAQFKVLRVELGEQVRLVKVKSLRDRALFVGPKNCFSLSASRFPGSREDSIYYTWVGYLGARLMEKLSVYSLKDGSMYSLKDGSNIFIRDDAVVHHGNWKPFDWFTPNLLAARPLDQAMTVSNKFHEMTHASINWFIQ